eukprot:XP_016652953.1 CIR protein [Plasmodium chabaudi chabaudi]
MNHEILCGLLIEADGYFNGKDVDAQRINDEPTIKGYCSNDGCKTNEAYINALAAYIFMLFKRSIQKDEYSEYDECFLMWLSDKLFKIHKEAKNIQRGYMDATTLNQAYKEYLEKHKQRLDYWNILNMQQGLKEANLKYMSEFYKLLNHICKIITYDETKDAKSREFSINSIGCSRQYKTLYNNISKCQSYLDLLNKLKGIYDDFSSAIMRNRSNNNLATKLKKLTKPDGKEMDAVRGFKTYNFSNSKCKFPPPKKKIKYRKSAKKWKRYIKRYRCWNRRWERSFRWWGEKCSWRKRRPR